MRRFRILLAGLALSFLGLPLGSLHAQAPAGLPTVGAGTAFGPTIENYLVGGPPLVVANLSGCVAGGGQAVAGNMGGIIKVTGGATAATTCTITWPVVWKTAPAACVINSETALQGATPIVVTVNNTTTLTWTYVSTGAAVFDIICLGRLN